MYKVTSYKLVTWNFRLHFYHLVSGMTTLTILNAQEHFNLAIENLKKKFNS